LELSGYFRG